MSNHQKILDKDRVRLLAACVLCQAQVCLRSAPLPEEVWVKELNLVFVEAK
jgi:hypothetical protein